MVSEEIGRLFGALAAATVRYIDDSEEVDFVGGWERDDRLAVPSASACRSGAARSFACATPAGPRESITRTSLLTSSASMDAPQA